MSRRSSYAHRIPERVLQRFTPRGDSALLREIEEATSLGIAAVVRRGREAGFSIVRNDTYFLVRPHPLWGRSPIGTYQDVIAALWAGDRWVAGSPEDDIQDGDDEPRGAA